MDAQPSICADIRVDSLNRTVQVRMRQIQAMLGPCPDLAVVQSVQNDVTDFLDNLVRGLTRDLARSNVSS